MAINDGGSDKTDGPDIPQDVDITRPSPARMYDYYLCGIHNFPVDRAAAEKIKAQTPDLEDGAWANRGFHQRAAIWLAERGIRQFIDIGSGLPTQGNTHDAVRKHAPDARVVYVDNDPMVAAYSAELLTEPDKTGVCQGFGVTDFVGSSSVRRTGARRR